MGAERGKEGHFQEGDEISELRVATDETQSGDKKNLWIDEDLHYEVKRLAIERRKPLSTVANELLRSALRALETAGKPGNPPKRK